MANPNGTPIWYELQATAADAAKAFYEAVVGWQIANSASLSEVEDLLDSLENQGVAEREVTLQSDRFAIRWQ